MIPQHNQFESQKFYIGQNLDVQDKYKKWFNGEVISINENKQILIHFTGWHHKHDEIIPINSGRLLKQYIVTHNDVKNNEKNQKQNNKIIHQLNNQIIKLNNRIDVYHLLAGWLEARVIQLQNDNSYSHNNHVAHNKISKVKVHFTDYHPKYDMWVNLNDKNQVATIGQRSKAYGNGKLKRSDYIKKVYSQLARELLRKKLLSLTTSLQSHNLTLKPITGDGNCLFRAVSNQLYGEQSFHQQIRHLCMKYILQQKQFFKNFIIEDIETYVERKSKDGVWGDDIQIEALSEIYQRPIQIYVDGIKPIRTFHEEGNMNVQPIRLAYIGECHYQSVKRRQYENVGLLNPSTYGQHENKFFQQYFYHKQHSQSSFPHTLTNRTNFSHFNPLQLTIQQQIQSETTSKQKNPPHPSSYNKQQKFSQQYQQQSSELDNNLMKEIIQKSQNQQIVQQIQAAQIKQLQKRLQQQSIQKQIKRLQQQQLQQVKKLSKLAENNKINFDHINFNFNINIPTNISTNISTNPSNIALNIPINAPNRPFWFEDLLNMGFTEQQILFAIQINGYNEVAVQNFLFEQM